MVDQLGNHAEAANNQFSDSLGKSQAAGFL